MRPSAVANPGPVGRLRLHAKGAVQGVGFRPFVYRLAKSLDLAGFVLNSPQGVTIEVEGAPEDLAAFPLRLRDELPPRAFLLELTATPFAPVGHDAFAIRPSDAAGARTALVLPDVSTCADCLRELRDPTDRRFRYPFLNCTNCGPRYSIVLGLPYDRARTTMARFPMCARCRDEYEDPTNRRFHAEPIACGVCGPKLQLVSPEGTTLASREDALLGAAEAVRTGHILAMKGLGGFHLVVDARSEGAVRELRRRKGREAKPFAVMAPSRAEALALGAFGPEEEALLCSPEAPIVLARRRSAELATSVAPENPLLGLLLPYTPIHHLLLAELGFAVVATSGNRTDEPICIDEGEARQRLGDIADVFLVHDRPIAHPVEDSVVRLIAGRGMLLRRARGYAPLPVATSPSGRAVLAVGGHQKNTVAFSSGGQIFLGPHVGDLDTAPAFACLEHTVDTLCRLYDLEPEVVACDAHPDYASTRFARARGGKVLPVQHHHAHVLAGMADNEIAPPVLGVAWDGSGRGEDGTVWGGEFLRIGAVSFDRVAWLHPFPLPGGERAVREPRRSALGALYAIHGDGLFDREGDAPLLQFTAQERLVLRGMLSSEVNSPRTSSAGRLFDAVASLTGLRQVARFEGQAAMALEFAMDGLEGDRHYPFELRADGTGLVVDWRPALEEVWRDARKGIAAGPISLGFHNTLAEMIVAVARRSGESRVVLSGGCFQNRYLSERAIQRLRAAGFLPFWHQRIPPNDGGIAVGQALAAARAGSARNEPVEARA
jgi:hydrogenase maturation protein HypF